MPIELEAFEKLLIFILLLLFSSVSTLAYLLYLRYRKSQFGNIILLLLVSTLLLLVYFSTGGALREWFEVFSDQLKILHKSLEVVAGILWIGVAYSLYRYTKRISE